MGIAMMHELCSLQLFRNHLTNTGLAAIVDNCTHLESLDLLCCFNVVMDGGMRAKCAGIKMFVDHSYGDIFPNGLLII